MNSSRLDIDVIKKRLLIKYPYFGSIIKNIKYQIDDGSLGIMTAGTDGKNIYFNEQYVQKLSDEEQVFLFAHEVCHIAFNHILRSKGKNAYLWNVATDAVINQQLKKDNLPIIEGGVDFEDAINFNAEQYYDKLVSNKQKDQQESDNKKQSSNEQSNPATGNDKSRSKKGSDSKNKDYPTHDLWKNIVEEDEKSSNFNSNQSNENKSNEEQNTLSTNPKIDNNLQDETELFEKNRQVRKKLAKRIKQQLKENVIKSGDSGKIEAESKFGLVGSATKPIYDWKRRLKKELGIEDERWGRKFSAKDNDYAMRIEDYEYDEQAETEIILDASGSVSFSLLRAFLRQVKTILKNSKIKVGFFADDFSGFQEIKTEKDIDNLQTKIYGGTNFDVASKSFSKDKNVNRICFTDGEDGGSPNITNPRKDIIWVSYQNKNFRPDKGKVIYVDPKDIVDYIIDVLTEQDEKLAI